MQTVIVFIGWTLFAILFQTVLFPHFPSFRASTNLIFYLVVILAFRNSFTTGIIISALLGYVMDAMSWAPHGMAVASYIIVLLFIKAVRANIYVESRLSLFMWVAAFSFLRQIVETIVLYTVTAGAIVGSTALWWIAVQSVLDAAIGIIAIPVIEKLLDTDWVMVFRKKGLRG